MEKELRYPYWKAKLVLTGGGNISTMMKIFPYEDQITRCMGLCGICEVPGGRYEGVRVMCTGVEDDGNFAVLIIPKGEVGDAELGELDLLGKYKPPCGVNTLGIR